MNNFAEIYYPLSDYVERADVVDVMADNPESIVLEKANNTREYVKDNRLTMDYWRRLARALSNLRRQPFDSNKGGRLSTILPNNHRIEFVCGNSCLASGLSVSIRVNRQKCYQLEDYGLTGSLRDEVVERIKEGAITIIVGGTNSGKTSLLKCIVNYLDESIRLITIEDAHELYFAKQKSVVNYLVNRNADNVAQQYRDHINGILRSNPDYIVMGEICGANTLPTLQCINSGESGFLTTIHANNSKLAIDKFRSNLQSVGISYDPQRELEQSVDLFICVQNLNGKRLITAIDFAKEKRLVNV